jgi:hypothetical protein
VKSNPPAADKSAALGVLHLLVCDGGKVADEQENQFLSDAREDCNGFSENKVETFAKKRRCAEIGARNFFKCR